jgi:2-oxoglutarate dehydrogenase complex dehydrogenase (E1) component-like enzyme
MGHVKAVQDCVNDQKGIKGTSCMSVLIHGDAALAGQGVVY